MNNTNVETPSGELWKLLAPPWHCFSAAFFIYPNLRRGEKHC